MTVTRKQYQFTDITSLVSLQYMVQDSNWDSHAVAFDAAHKRVTVTGGPRVGKCLAEGGARVRWRLVFLGAEGVQVATAPTSYFGDGDEIGGFRAAPSGGVMIDTHGGNSLIIDCAVASGVLELFA